MSRIDDSIVCHLYMITTVHVSVCVQFRVYTHGICDWIRTHMSDHDMYTNVFMYDHDRTSSRSPAFAPSDTSLSTVFAILFSVAMCKAVFLSFLSCVDDDP